MAVTDATAQGVFTKLLCSCHIGTGGQTTPPMAVKSMMVTKKSFFIKLDVYVSKEMAVCAVVPLFLSLLHLYDVVVLLAFLGENILVVEDGFCADLGVDIRNFLFVDAHSVALNHLAALAL